MCLLCAMVQREQVYTSLPQCGLLNAEMEFHAYLTLS
jgi:hypothetical protein